MTDSTEPRAEGLKPCPNVECRNSTVHFIATGASSVDEGYISCPLCGMSGPMADTEAESGCLWNALPRPTTDTVERAAVDLEPLKKLARTWRKSKSLMGPREYQDHPAKMSVWQRTTYHCGKELAEAIRALPSAAGGEDKLRENLRRVTDHLATWAADHSHECTAEIDAAIYCARAALQQEPTK